MRIVIAKEAFNRKISPLTSKLTPELRKKLVRYYIRSTAIYGSETWTLRNWSASILSALKCGARRMEKINWPEEVTNGEVLNI